ncbi:MAG: ribonuclease domain-containing protein [Bacteroidota bacterium]|jgi:guanyl-specific ribonuclease Sa
MRLLQKLKLFFCFFLLLTGTLASCLPSEKTTQNTEDSYHTSPNDSNSTRKHRKRHRKHNNSDQNDKKSDKYNADNRINDNKTDISTGNAPTQALKVLKYVRENGQAMEGYVGGRRFGNFEGLLPKKDGSGSKINYQEWDVNPKVNGKNRGTERLITGSDGKAYYTNDHYRSFVLVK